MLYYTGSAANVAAILTAITDACVAEGWSWNSGTSVLSETDIDLHVRFSTSTVSGVALLRAWIRNAADSDECPYYVSMCCPIKSVDVAYPVTYHIFVFASEVFAVINYSDKYQWLAFGQSDQGGLPGSGNWMSATQGHLNPSSPNYPTGGVWMKSDGTSNLTYDLVVCPGLGWSNKGRTTTTTADWQNLTNFWMHSGLQSNDYHHPWMYTAGAIGAQDTAQVGILWAVELIATQPNNFNNEGVLLPIKIFQKRPESKVSQVLQVQNARNIRIDTYTPGEIIQLGTDYWMIFPWYRKYSAARDGGQSVDHTGTFGWAIKYETA